VLQQFLINRDMDYDQLQKYNVWREEVSRQIFSRPASDVDHLRWVLNLLDTTDDDILRIEARLYCEYSAVFLAREYIKQPTN